jgi:hypothetical protein
MLPWPLLDQLRGFADLSVGLVSGLVYASAEDRCIGVEAAQRLRKPRSPAAGAPTPSRKVPDLARKLAGLIARLRGLRLHGKKRRAPGSRLRGPSSELRAQGSQPGRKAKAQAFEPRGRALGLAVRAWGCDRTVLSFAIAVARSALGLLGAYRKPPNAGHWAVEGAHRRFRYARGLISSRPWPKQRRAGIGAPRAVVCSVRPPSRSTTAGRCGVTPVGSP